MIIKKLSIENFLTIGSIQCSLDHKGLVLIQGENADDTSQDSNGAGKSSIPDAIAWALFGNTARGETGDRVVNRKAKSNCCVKLEIDDDGTTYIIERYRKHKTHKNRLAVTKGNTDLSKGTDKLTQELVYKIIGCSEEVFNAAIYAGQDAMSDLPGMTDKQLKLLVEEAAGIDRLQEAHKAAQGKLRAATQNYKDAVNEKNLVETKIMSATSNKESIDEKAYDFEQERKKDLAAKTKELKNLRDEMPAHDSDEEFHTKRLKQIEAKRKKIDKALASIQDEKKEEQRLLDEEDRANKDDMKKTWDFDRADEELNKAKEKLTEITKSQGKACDECGKPYTAEDLKSAIEKAEKKVEQCEAEWHVKEKELAAAEKFTLLKRSERENYQSSMTDTSKQNASLKTLQSARELSLKQLDRVSREREKLRNAMSEFKARKSEVNPFSSLSFKAEKELDDLRKDLKACEKKIDEAQAEVSVAGAVEKVFGQGGVRAQILDTVTPFLNQRTTEYLSALTDDNIHALWSTITTTATGDIREKFTISVSSKVGAANFKGLSGGEKRKVRLACSMALQDLVASRASKPIQLYIADEIDHALDESGLERLMDILHEKAKSRGTVLVISHNSLSDWISNSVTVVKEKGVSRLEGVL